MQAEDGIRDIGVTGVQTCALPICATPPRPYARPRTRTGTSNGTSGRIQELTNAGGRWGRSPAAYESATAAAPKPAVAARLDRKSGAEGKRVDLGGARNIKKKNYTL